MKTLHVAADGRGNARLRSLPLPFVYTGAAATAQDALAGADTVITYAEACPIRRLEGQTGPDVDAGGRYLDLVTAGALHVMSPDAQACLEPGDALLVEALPSRGTGLTYSGDCYLIQVAVGADGVPHGVVPPVTGRPADGASRSAPQPVEMYVRGDLSYFRALERFFPTEGSAGSTQPVDDVKFIAFSAGHAGTWHTDAHTNIIVVASGTLELQVSGGGQESRRFYPGDVCLVQDLTGQGHILRAYGETRIVAITIPDAHQWSR